MRPHPRVVLGALVAAAVVLAAPLAAQTIQGKVMEEGTRNPIAEVEVILQDGKGEKHATVLSDSLGAFRLTAPAPGEYTLHVRRIGYASQTTQAFEVVRWEVVAVEVTMSVAALRMEPLVVVERKQERSPFLKDFYRRAEFARKSGLGRIYTRKELEGAGSVRYLYMMQPGGRNCPMTVLVDDLPVEDPLDLDFLADLDQVEGVEVYRSQLQIPPEYTRLRSCALMLVWTRPPAGRPFTWKRLLIGSALAATLFFVVR
jgi:hypothetical protein